MTPADMKGMKIRIQPSPVFKALVESLGASASAIPWGELPTALQQKVVDGQENGVTNILAASLYQHQKYATLDGHVWSVHGYLVNDRFYGRLTDVEKKAVNDGVQKAMVIHRKMTADQDKGAKKILEGVGMQVYVPTAAQVAEFRNLDSNRIDAAARGRVFSGIDVAGFSTFGEILGLNLNQTLTAVFFLILIFLRPTEGPLNR